MTNQIRISETATNDQNPARRKNALWITMVLGGMGVVTTAFYILVAFQLHKGHLVIPIIILLLFTVVAFIANRVARQNRVTLAVLMCIAELAIVPILLAFFMQGVGLTVGVVAFLVITIIAAQMLPQSWVLYSIAVGVIGAVLAGVVDYYIVRWQVFFPVVGQVTPWILGAGILIFCAFMFRQFRSMPLTSKLIIALLISTLSISTAVTGYTLTQTTSVLTRNVGGQLKSLADTDARAIGNFLDGQIQALTILAGSKTLEDAVVSANDSYLGMDDAAIQTKIARRQEQWLAAISAEGIDASTIQNTLIGSAAVDLAKYHQVSPANLDAYVADRYGGLVAASTRIADYDQSDQLWWQAAYNQGYGNFVYVSPGTVQGNGKEQTLIFATPVYDRLGNVIGVLRATYSFSAIVGLLKTTGETGQSFLLFPTDPPQQFHQGAIAPADASLLAAMASIGKEDYIQYNFDEQERFVSTSRVSASLSSPWVDSVGWNVVITQDLEETLAPVNAQIHLTTILVIIVVGVIAIIAMAVAGVIARPILSLTDIASRVSAGDFSARATVQSNDEIGDLAVAFNYMADQLQTLITSLEQHVADRTVELEAANKELEAFAYSVSHDLRAPLRHVDGFLGLLQEKTTTTLDEQSQHYMANISDAAKRMGTLIDDLLSFSRMGRQEMSKAQVDLGNLVREAIGELEPEAEGRNINWQIGTIPIVMGDQAMLKIVLVNLISNALKFTSPRQQAEIEIGCTLDSDTEVIIFVRDNGVGFDMNYIDKLFGVFQRLHRADEFEGTGIGLANVRRVISRHGGRTWAEGEVDSGATFYFSLPQST